MRLSVRLVPLALLLALLVGTVTAAAVTSSGVPASSSSSSAAAAAQVTLTPLLRSDALSSLLRGARSMALPLGLPALAPLSFSAQLGAGVTPANISALIRDRFGSSSKVDEVRGAIPRWGGPDTFQPEDSDYQREIINQVAPGAALLVVTLIIWVAYAIAQCCCCRSKPEGYTRRERLIPLVLGSLFALVIVAFAIIGCYYTEQFDKELSGSTGLTRTSNLVLVHVQDFFSLMQNKMDDTSALVRNLAGSGGTIQQRVEAFPSLGRGLDGFLDDMKRLGSDAAASSPVVVEQVEPAPGGPTDPESYTCIFCTQLETQMRNVANEIDESATPVYARIESTKEAALTELVAVNEEIQSRIGDARTQVADINDKATEYNDQVVKYTDYVDKYEKIRRPVVLVLFLLPLALVLLWFGAVVVARKEFGGKVLVHLLFPLGILIFIIFAIHLPFSLLVADSCHYLDEHEPNLSSLDTFEPIVADTLTACMARQNLLSALGVADDLDFTDKIVFPTVPSVDGLLDADRLRALDQTVQAVTRPLAFPSYNEGDKSEHLDQLNALTNQAPHYDYFGFANVSDCVPLIYVPNSDAVWMHKSAILTSLSAEAQMDAVLGSIRANMSSLMTDFGELTSTTSSLLTSMAGLNTTVTPLLDAAQSVIAIAYCTPLDEDYLLMKQTYCDKMIVSVSALAMASFFVGVFMLLLNVCLWFLVYRLQHGAETVAHAGLVIGAGGAMEGGGMTVAAGASPSPLASPSAVLSSPSGMGGGDRSLELAPVPVAVNVYDGVPLQTNEY